MRILYFSRDYTTHDHRFLSALAQTEHKVAYLRLEQRGHTLEDRALPPQIEQVLWKGGQQPFTYRRLPPLLLDLKRVIRQVQPEVVQAGPIQTAAFLVALSGFPHLVSMSWGYDLLHDAHLNSWMGWITRFTLRRSKALVDDCDTVRKQAVAFGMPPEWIVTFPWGVDLKHFTPVSLAHGASPGEGGEQSAPLSRRLLRSLGRGARCEATAGEGIGRNLGPNPHLSAPDEENGWDSSRPLVLLSTRSWEQIYGVDVLAQGFALAAQQCPELRLVMLGSGSLAGTLRQIFNRAGVSEQVFFPGQVSQNELPRFYRQADLYVSASRTDGTSISLLEALACGTPALLSDIPGNREWIEQGVQGWFFDGGDASALARSILQAAEQRPRLAEMRQAARALAEARADWEVNFQKLFKAYSIATRTFS